MYSFFLILYLWFHHYAFCYINICSSWFYYFSILLLLFIHIYMYSLLYIYSWHTQILYIFHNKIILSFLIVKISIIFWSWISYPESRKEIRVFLANGLRQITYAKSHRDVIPRKDWSNLTLKEQGFKAKGQK